MVRKVLNEGENSGVHMQSCCAGLLHLCAPLRVDGKETPGTVKNKTKQKETMLSTHTKLNLLNN